MGRLLVPPALRKARGLAWFSALPSIFVTVVVLLLPGMLVCLAAGMRWVMALLYGAMVSVGIIGVLAVLYGFAHIPFTPLTVAAGALAIILIVAVVRWLLARFEKVPFRLPHGMGGPDAADVPVSRPRALWAAFIGGGIINAFVWVMMYAKPFRSPENYQQIYDVPFHFSVIRFLLQTKNGSSLTSAAVEHTVGSTFYPVGWHDTVVLTIQATGASIPVAVNASVSAILLVVLPLSIAALAIRLFGFRARYIFIAIAFSSLLQAFPWRFLTFGVLYSNLLSYALLPAFLAMFTVVVSWRKMGWSARTALAAVALMGFAGVLIAQPNSAFTSVVLLWPYLVLFMWQGCARVADVRRRRRIFAGMFAAFFVLTVGAWLVLYHLPALKRTVTWGWPPIESPSQAAGAALFNGMAGQGEQFLISFFIIGGTILAIRQRRMLWVAAAHWLMALFYVITAGYDSVFRSILTGFWYHDSVRLAASTAFTGVMLATAAAVALAQWLVRLVREKMPRLRSRDTGRTLTASLVLVSLVVVGGTVFGAGLQDQRRVLRSETSYDPAAPLVPAESRFLAEVSKKVPRNAVIANNPYDGSVFGYSLYNMNTYFRSFEGNWIGKPSADQRELKYHLNDIANPDDAAVCRAVKRTKVQYVLVMGFLYRDGKNASYTTYVPSEWRGFRITPETPGFEVVARDGGNVLYRVTGCA